MFDKYFKKKIEPELNGFRKFVFKELGNVRDEVQSVRKAFFDTVIASAMASGINAKKLAKFYNGKKIEEFAQKFNEEVGKLASKRQDELHKRIATGVKKAGSKATVSKVGRPRKSKVVKGKRG